MSTSQRGVVLRGTGGVWHIRSEQGDVHEGSLPGRVKKDATMKLAVGDEVRIERDEHDRARQPASLENPERTLHFGAAFFPCPRRLHQEEKRKSLESAAKIVRRSRLCAEEGKLGGGERMFKPMHTSGRRRVRVHAGMMAKPKVFVTRNVRSFRARVPARAPCSNGGVACRVDRRT